MTTKILTGTYTAGYALMGQYSALDITGTGRVLGAVGLAGHNGGLPGDPPTAGGVGGNGVSAGSYAQVANDGTVIAGAGGVGGGSSIHEFYAGAPGGAGGTGIALAAGGGVANTGLVAGGAGGASGYGAYSTVGGAGGLGIALATPGSVANSGSIFGGQGGEGVLGSYAGGAGGAGGASMVLAAGGTVANSGVIAGGLGGGGNYGRYGSGAGGAGGTGVSLAGVGTVTNIGRIAGGSGGAGGGSDYGHYAVAAGGAGGAGVSLATIGYERVNNSGVITGGAGGAGGYVVLYPGAPGGAGGAGVIFNFPGIYVGFFATLYNAIGGVIAGGAGGVDIPASKGNGGPGGAGGAGVILTGGYYNNVNATPNSVANEGVIRGGAGGAGAPGYASGAAGDGVVVNPAGYSADIYNGFSANHTALIEGQIGVYVAPTTGYAPNVYVSNWGTIAGDGGVAVKFTSANDALTANAGSHFIGAAQGGGGVLIAGGTGTISLQGGSGTLAGDAALNFSGFGDYIIKKGAAWTLSGTNTLLAGQSLVAQGSLTIGGTLTSAATASIDVGGYGQITLKGADIVGGGLSSYSSGAVAVSGRGNMLDGTTTPVIVGVGIVIGDAAALRIQGAITNLGGFVNSGAISLAAGSHHADLIVGAAGATLSGGGSVILGDNALNTIRGVGAAATLTNVDNTISGAGRLGAGRMTLINEAKGVIDATGTLALNIDTGSSTIVNAGTIEATGTGGAVVAGAIANTGVLAAAGGNLTVRGAVTGRGSARIDGGTLDFASSFTEKVVFTAATGVLELARSRTYRGTISGFSLTGGTSLDLRDIGFVNAGEATFSGTASGGVLTVTDGTNTAHIKLTGDYTHATFVASSDGHGGVTIVDPPATAGAVSRHAFIAAMAGLGVAASGSIQLAAEIRPRIALSLAAGGHPFA
ncbi:MAG: hypothetical protein ABI306_10395 [Caulobacteraceae bacterium]